MEASRGHTTGEAERRAEVLVVDDDEFVRDALIRSLSRHGIATVGVATGEAAFAALDAAKGAVRVVLVDLFLERERGDALARSLVMTHPDLRCIVMSGGCDPEREAAICAMDRVEFLAKPCSSQDVVAKLWVASLPTT